MLNRHPFSALRRLQKIGFIGLAALCIALPAQAQWKWKDAAGKVQYSDLPPPNGTPEKDILQRPPGQKLQITVVPTGQPAAAASVPAPARAASGPSKAELDKQKQQEQEQLTKQKEEERKVAAQRKENCQRAQDQLKMLQDGIRMTKLNERGENVVLDDRMRADEMQRARSVTTSECR